MSHSNRYILKDGSTASVSWLSIPRKTTCQRTTIIVQFKYAELDWMDYLLFCRLKFSVIEKTMEKKRESAAMNLYESLTYVLFFYAKKKNVLKRVV